MTASSSPPGGPAEPLEERQAAGARDFAHPEPAAGFEPPYRFDKTADAAVVRERFGGLPPDSRTGERVSVAGRAMLLRPQGRLAFAELRDWTGSLQLFAGAEFTPGFDRFSRLSMGDWVGASGEVMTTRRGELSVRVEDWVLLAKARRGFGDKWRGVTDVETRWRQRYVDLWANEGVRETLLVRSRVLSALRRVLEERGFVEVETPALHPIPGGALARPFVTRYESLDAEFYLRVAPELYLKRLVVGGFEKVFEIGRVFRNEGLSPKYNPEFTMLELYWAYADYLDMMGLTEDLVAHASRVAHGGTVIAYGGAALDLTPPWRRATLTELVAEHVGETLELEMGRARLAAAAHRLGVPVEEAWGPGKVLLEIYEKTTEPALWGPVIVCDYPVEVSPLARAHRSKPGFAERFEVVAAGRELANAFSELVDPLEQRRRFEEQARLRAAGDAEAMRVDEDYVRALEYGLPPTAGLGIGIDRLVMLLADAANIREVIAFPALRPERRPDRC